MGEVGGGEVIAGPELVADPKLVAGSKRGRLRRTSAG